MNFLFDMDGVIADTNATHKESILEFCQKYDVEINDQILAEKVYGRVNADWIPAVFGEMSSEKLEQLSAEKEAHFRKLYAPKLEAVKGLIPFLEAIKQYKYKAAVATSAPRENADFILDGLNIRSYFQAVLDSSYVTNGKPHPEIYLKAAQQLKVESKNCIVLEDSLSGVEAGKAAGAKVIGITTTHSAEELKNADWIIDDFEGLVMENIQDLLYRSNKA